MQNLQEIIQFNQFDNMELIAKQVVEGFITGLHKSPFHGFSVEFAEHRLYNTGESTKHIDWKLFARTERLYVKRYEEETNLRAFIVLDTSSSMMFPLNQAKTANKFSFSLFSAAALIYLLRKQRDAVGLASFSNEIDLFTDAKLSIVHAQFLYSELNKLFSSQTELLNRKTNIAKALHQIAESVHKRSLIILFSDFFDFENKEDVFAALQHLRFNGHEVIFFHVTDKNLELDFNFENRPYKFIDLENEQVVRFNPSEIKAELIKKLSDHQNEIKLRCGQYKIDLVEVDSNSNFAEILVPFLIKRSKLF